MVKLDESATAVARFNANSDRANLNCNRNPQNSKSYKDEIAGLGITQVLGHYEIKTHKNIYKEICSIENLGLAFKKAKKNKSSMPYVKEFEKDLWPNLLQLKKELENFTYKPLPLKRFIVRDPKTRTIHSSAFKDRVLYHAIVNILEPIYEKKFIYDSYANRKNKGTHRAVLRFDEFKRKVSNNGMLTKNSYNNNSVKGYVFKADIKHYFETVDHRILLNILRRTIKDKKVIWLIKKILNNFNTKTKGKGMPLGNLTSQFFANVYLNDLDYFVKHKLKAKYYIRYVDDFVILHNDKNKLKEYKEKIEKYLKNLKLELHQDKSKIIPLRKNITFLGYRIFYHYKLLRKSNLTKFQKDLNRKLKILEMEAEEKQKEILNSLQGWFGYAKWANTYKLRKSIIKKVKIFKD